ncbi:peptide ABC transporter substrate-binding protein [Hyphobacterium sp. HN65]|uniref:Peptide ABC transporter substrate-binding protein n=1 Tax=Hyphobacterium lacteum TaxID=3116575 RepID=A0ABU7LR51_9PROT|nr:peptide ABC transporter substrate-binding protein [Hyphobacterium sp. HN65]MEE2526393.1 peptide ABC transporter substrate-binding protein [Hyphobacterium sp. HN65]
MALLAGLATTGLAACSGRRAAPSGLLRVAIANQPDSLDPAIGQFAASALLYKQLFMPLADYGNDLRLAPGLAERWETPDNGRTWRFFLRDDLRWSDGRMLTADDVVWSVQRFLDPATAGGELGDFFAVENALSVLAGDAPVSALGINAPSANIVEFRLNQRLGLFPLLMREFYPFPRHIIETHGNDWVRPEHFVGSGPFTLAGRGALSFDLVRNDYAIRPASVPAVRVDVVDEPSTRVRMFRAGEFDLVEQPPAMQIASLRERLGAQIQSFPAPKFTYLKINLRRPPLDQVALRRAMSVAIDRRFLAEQILGGTAIPTESVMRRGIISNAGVDLARTYLEQAGLTGANQPRIVLRTTSGERERLAIAIADDWNRAGIETELLATAPVDLYSAVDGGDFDTALSHFDRGLKTDPNFLMEPFTQGGFADDSGWFDRPSSETERYNLAIDGARSEVAEDVRTRLYANAEAILLTRQIIIPLLHEQAHWLISERVSGLTNGVQPQLWRGLNVGGA